MRTFNRDIFVDVGMFSAHQLHPRELLRQQLQGFSGWVATYLVSHPVALFKHRTSLVYIQLELSYDQMASYGQFDVIRQENQVRLMRKGTRLVSVARYYGGGRHLADVSAICCMLNIEDMSAASARPGVMSDELQKYLQDDEKEDASPERTLPSLVASIEGKGSLLAQGQHRFQLSRNICEFADQWLFFQIPSLYEPAREALSLQHGDAQPVLKQGLTRPLRSVSIELSRPFYVFDTGCSDTRAYEIDGRLACIHRLCSEQPGTAAHALVVERFR